MSDNNPVIQHPLTVGTPIHYFRRESCRRTNRQATGIIKAVYNQNGIFFYRIIGASTVVHQRNIIKAGK